MGLWDDDDDYLDKIREEEAEARAQAAEDDLIRREEEAEARAQAAEDDRIRREEEAREDYPPSRFDPSPVYDEASRLGYDRNPLTISSGGLVGGITLRRGPNGSLY